MSSPQATVIAVSTDSRDLYSCYIARHWSHVEFSEGYLTHCTTRPSAVVVRRKMANTLPPPAPVRDERESEAPSEQQSFALEIDSVLEAPAPRNAPAPRIVAFKLRWPFHLSASPRPALLHLHDLRDGSVVSVDIQALFHIPHIAYDPCVHYIELIQDRLLIAGKVSVTSWHLEHACVATWPPRAPASTSDSLEESPSPPESIQHQPDHYRDWNPGDDDAFTAVHHDCRPGSSAHGNLVATFSNGRGCGGKIYWSPNAQLVTTYGASVEAVTQQTVVLVTVSLSRGHCRAQADMNAAGYYGHAASCRKWSSCIRHSARARVGSLSSLDFGFGAVLEPRRLQAQTTAAGELREGQLLASDRLMVLAVRLVLRGVPSAVDLSALPPRNVGRCYLGGRQLLSDRHAWRDA